MRRLYPTPGRQVSNNDSLEAMPTPETPYGSAFYDNPSSRVRKAFKRAIDSLPDDPVPLKRQKTPYVETPVEVYFKRHADNLTKFIENHPPPTFDDETKENTTPTKEDDDEIIELDQEPSSPKRPADHHGPLTGVVVYTTKKLLEIQQSVYQTVAELGGDYQWTYDQSVTHLVHLGRQNDTNKEFRLARDKGIHIVAPDWIWMCRDEKRLIDESLFPHTHNPKMSLSIITTKSSVPRKRNPNTTLKGPSSPLPSTAGCSTPMRETDLENTVLDEEEENPIVQLEELESLAKSRRTSNVLSKTKSNSPMPTTSEQQKSNPAKPNAGGKSTDTESQGIGITWEDPADVAARQQIEGQMVLDTQDIISKNVNVTIVILNMS